MRCVNEVNARYGLRGMRVGEASNPEPRPGVPRTQVDSDDEPIISSRRNAFPETVSSTTESRPQVVAIPNSEAGLVCSRVAVVAERADRKRLRVSTGASPASTMPAVPSSVVDALEGI